MKFDVVVWLMDDSLPRCQQAENPQGSHWTRVRLEVLGMVSKRANRWWRCETDFVEVFAGSVFDRS